MRYYPVFLDVSGKKCLVAGGGRVGTRKAKMLFKCGAQVTVISLEFSSQLTEFAKTHPVTLKNKAYEEADTEKAFLVIAATGDRALNLKIKNDANHLNILCNIADQPEESDFLVPSVVNRGDLSIAISTSGKSPALAKKLREDLEKAFGWEYASGLMLLGRLREKLLQESHDPEGHKTIFEILVHQGLIQLLREGALERVETLLYEATGKAYKLTDFISEADLKSRGGCFDTNTKA